MQNYYEMFGISPSASTEEIKKLVLHQLRIWNQRTNAPQIERRQEAERMIRVLEEMETILLDEQKRTEYDQRLQMERVETISIDDTDEEEESAGIPVSDREVAEKIGEGWLLLKQGKAADALLLALRLTDRVTDHPEAWALLGRARFQSGEAEEAIQPLVKACDLHPKNAAYAFSLGEIFESLNRNDRAEEQYKLALTLSPENTQYKYRLGSFYVKTNRAREGLRLLEHCLSEEPNNPDYQKELAKGYLEIACSSWTVISPGHPYLPAGRYPTDKIDMTMAEVYVSRANAIPFDDQELREKLNLVRADIEKKKGRKFTGSWTAVIISILSLITIEWINPSWLNFLFMFLPGLYIISALTPQYRIYQKGIQGESSYTDFAYLFRRLKDRFGDTAYLLMILFYLVYSTISQLVLSIVIIYNFYRNYLVGNSKK
ncbi:tetratricopeptide repeat protein [Paenactinomyces guangxiensis]|uniref:Tetratricopeptide repeat protein n=1 Tax=Paenactinomyces guangxiensis TaxID=1490290 RepID=A0A7W1WTJ0_9BACL|nr:tetratricopeptide repeat protein [Paenactinomyces guangxiensis]MBA4495790.1 tetratricopeptide repeat protein [Paenactinomyces guangxiensis]MBH8592880.1 tetratricopeptide repeat protein [Paenactinomyces guangxiensis]